MRYRYRQGSHLLSLFLLVLGLGLASGCEIEPHDDQEVPRRERPLNLVFVLSDALRASNLPTYGYPRQTAPFLTRLADESLVFRDHLANYPGTPNSVSQIMTGRLMPPLLMGADWALTSIRKVESDLPILPRILSDAGYSTGLVSSHPWFNRSARVLDHFDSASVVMPNPPQTYAAFESLLEPSLDFLDGRAQDGRPFFLYIHSMDTHAPYRLREDHEPPSGPIEWPDSYDRYDSEILYTDHGVERLVAHLKDLGLWEQTLFVFTSDHGEDLHELGPEWWNEAHGSSLHRSQLHVSLIVSVPGAGDLRGEYEAQSRHVDLLPTLMSLLGVGTPAEDLHIDGRDLLASGLQVGPHDAKSPAQGLREGASGRYSVAYSWRYWSLYRGEHEAIYDQWTDEVTLYRSVPDARNYPMPEEVHDPELKKELGTLLARERRTHLGRFLALPPEPPVRAIVGIPTTVVHGETESMRTFVRSPMDDLWMLKNHQLLLSDPREEPDPLVLATPWAPGVYRVAVRSPPQSGLSGSFRIQFLGADNPPLEVDAGNADARGWIGLGQQEIGEILKVRISRPQGGVALSAFALERIGAEAPEPSGDDAQMLEERLRALGYVQ